MQHTIARKAEFRGVGLHLGHSARLAILPAPVDHGIVFARSDLGGARIPARWDLVTASPLCTEIRNADGVSLSTIEHVMAAIAGLGIANALITVDGPEVPILDGSAADFVDGILTAGIRAQAAPTRAIRVLRPVKVSHNGGFARLSPSATLRIDFDIDFSDAAIGHQAKHLDMANGSFVRELMDSRTFCSLSEVEMMQKSGRALGGTFHNAVVFDGGKVLSPGGLRHADEPVRHKMLDAMGDLALAGAPLLACYTGHHAGHAMTNKLLRALFATPDAWDWVTLSQSQERRLPGAGVSAAYRTPRPRLEPAIA